MDKLKELLDGLVAEKSLSFEVLEQLRKVKTESDDLIGVNLSLSKLLKEGEDIILDNNKRISELNSIVNNWKERESSLIARENTVLDIEHKNEIEKLKATHADDTLKQVKEVVAMVFKNSILRKNIMGNDAVSGGANPNSYSNSSVNLTETMEQD